MPACVVFYILLATNLCFGEDFSIVSNVLYDTSGDVLAAFGDFNADKLIDIFVISHSGRSVDVLLAQEKNDFRRTVLLRNDSLDDAERVTGVMVADFNGDVLMDVLVCRKASQAPDVRLAVYWGNGTAVNTLSPFRFNNESFRDEPILFDYNVDMKPDLLTEGLNGDSVVWQANDTGFSRLNFTKSFHLGVPHSSAFVDLNGDLNADLLLTKEKNEFEVFYDGNYESPTSYSFIIDQGVVGQSSFADFNQDGHIDHIVTVCRDQHDALCGDGAIYMWDGKNQSQWVAVSQEFKSDWLILWDGAGQLASLSDLTVPATLRVGDYDMDGYPDLLVVLCSKDSPSTRRPFLLRNFLNSPGGTPSFILEPDVLPPSLNSTVSATFYDYAEDGMPDIVVTKLLSDGVPSLALIKNNLALDTCFLKVTVVSGLCSNNCPNGRKPYGVNVPGPTIAYETTQANGYPQTSCAGQLSQSAHFALQLPFVSFGLGQTPNFVDKVRVAIPQPKNANRTKQWTQIIPNAQLIVNPNPITDPSSWKMKLFVVPSQQIYLTGIALLSTCVILALIVGLLLWNERREDALEKKQASQKFHFDAM